MTHLDLIRNFFVPGESLKRKIVFAYNLYYVKQDFLQLLINKLLLFSIFQAGDSQSFHSRLSIALVPKKNNCGRLNSPDSFDYINHPFLKVFSARHNW